MTESPKSDTLKVNTDITEFEKAREIMGRGEVDTIIELPKEFGVPNDRGVPSGNMTVFFPRFLMLEWLQGITGFLPLTPVIDGMRQIMTEGKQLLDLGPEFGLIGIWIVVVYFIAVRVFRWE